MAATPEFTEAFFKALCSLPEMRKPQTNLVDYIAIFKSSVDDPAALVIIQQLEETRRRVVSLLKTEGRDANDDHTLRALDEYLPLSNTLLQSIKQSTEALRLDARMAFQWEGSLNVTRYECADIIYDLMMTHVAKAIVHSRVAARLISSGPCSDLRAAGEHLKHAMGVLLSLRTIIPTWLAPPEMKRPMELFEPVRNALFLYFSALASKLAVIKAMQKEGGTAASLMCKLCIYVSNQMGGAIALLSTYPSEVHSDVLLRGALDREVFAALAMFYYAEDAYAQLETGIALGFCQLALRKLVTQQSSKFDATKPGLPNLSVRGYVHLNNIVEVLVAKIKALHQKVDKDNSMVYFKRIPAPENLPELPTGISIMEPAQFVMSIPEQLPVFKYNPKEPQSIFDAIGDFFKGGSKSSSDTPAVTGEAVVGIPSVLDPDCPPSSRMLSSCPDSTGLASTGAVVAPQGSGLSDYEFALQLQAQYDAESHPPRK